MNEIIILGIGHRARHGKDYLAKYLQTKLDNAHIIHWADDLKTEVMNRQRAFPLIYKSEEGGLTYYNILNIDKNNVHKYHTVSSETIPFLDNIFNERKIDTYWGMDGDGSDDLKDGPMLQFWGTDYRRKLFDPNWWVNLTIQKAVSISNSYGNPTIKTFVFVPDTRFPNEVTAVRTVKEKIKDPDVNIRGYYIKVSRINEDGTPYFDPSRDRNHPSECALEGVPGDYEVVAMSGDIDKIYRFGDELIKELDK